MLIYVNKMKIQKSDTGSLILLDEADNILYLFLSFKRERERRSGSPAKTGLSAGKV